jgi:hypothetical protein
LTTGSNNTALGYNSLTSLTTGSNNTAFGNSAQIYNNASNSTVIGCNAQTSESNRIVLGTSSETVMIPGSLNVTTNSKFTGNVGIGKTPTSNALDINGNVEVTGNLHASGTLTGSDYRIKENVISLDSSYTVDNLKPVTYFHKLSQRQDIGLIAHELQEYYPCLVKGEKDGEEYQKVNYNGLIPILIKEIQELKRKQKEICYKGKGTIINNSNVDIFLQDIDVNINDTSENNFIIQITPIYNGKIQMYNSSELENNKFTVYGENGSFYWAVIRMQNE